jgi:hypothetical protein
MADDLYGNGTSFFRRDRQGVRSAMPMKPAPCSLEKDFRSKEWPIDYSNVSSEAISTDYRKYRAIESVKR